MHVNEVVLYRRVSVVVSVRIKKHNIKHYATLIWETFQLLSIKKFLWSFFGGNFSRDTFIASVFMIFNVFVTKIWLSKRHDTIRVSNRKISTTLFSYLPTRYHRFNTGPLMKACSKLIKVCKRSTLNLSILSNTLNFLHLSRFLVIRYSLHHSIILVCCSKNCRKKTLTVW